MFRDEIGAWGRVYGPEEVFTVGVVSMPALRRPALTGDKRRFGAYLPLHEGISSVLVVQINDEC